MHEALVVLEIFVEIGYVRRELLRRISLLLITLRRISLALRNLALRRFLLRRFLLSVFPLEFLLELLQLRKVITGKKQTRRTSLVEFILEFRQLRVLDALEV